MPAAVRYRTTIEVEVVYNSTSPEIVAAVGSMLPGRRVAIAPDVREDDALLYTIVSTRTEVAH